MFKTAIVGCGLIATEKHIPILHKLRNRAAIVGLCDLNTDVLKHIASKFGISDAYTDFDEMMSKERPDLVIICTPPQTHAGLAIKAMEEGAHVLVEKPIALSSADCDRMIEASVKHDRKLGVMHNQLFNPALQQALDIVSSGRFGRFLGMRVFLGTSVDAMTSKQDHWAHKLPGGVIGETGPHAVYLSLAFLRKVKDVQVSYKKLLPEYPWSVAEDIRFDLIADNGLSSVTLTYGSNQMAGELDILCTEALLKLDLESRVLFKYNRPTLSAYRVGKSVLSIAYQMTRSLAANTYHYVFSKNLDGHYRGINRFLDHLTEGASYPATGEDGKQVVAVMEMIVQRMKEFMAQS